MKFVMSVVFILLFSIGLHSKSISSLSDYPSFCKLAAEDDQIFKNFRRNPTYQNILEHVTYGLGMEYLKFIEEHYPFMLSHVEKFRENDSKGNPNLYDFPNGWGRISPTTLRYIKVAGDLISSFGDLSKMNIVEIGGGYGGQCKVISSLSGFRSYTIFDLHEASLLANKYLKSLGVKRFKCLSNMQLPSASHYDLVISNYAVSEICRDEQLLYIEKVINKSKMGYITYNTISSIFGVDSLSVDQFCGLIRKANRSIQIIPEAPSSGTNVIIIWNESP